MKLTGKMSDNHYKHLTYRPITHSDISKIKVSHDVANNLNATYRWNGLEFVNDEINR